MLAKCAENMASILATKPPSHSSHSFINAITWNKSTFYSCSFFLITIKYLIRRVDHFRQISFQSKLCQFLPRYIWLKLIESLRRDLSCNDSRPMLNLTWLVKSFIPLASSKKKQVRSLKAILSSKYLAFWGLPRCRTG